MNLQYRWEKKKGDAVREDDVVAEIETDKTAIPVPAPRHGIIEELLVEDGATVKAGQELFKLKVTDQPPAGAEAAPPKKAEAPAAAAPPPPPPPPPQPSSPPPAAPKPTPPPPPPPPAQRAGKYLLKKKFFTIKSLKRQ